jgi:hypothetical protein
LRSDLRLYRVGITVIHNSQHTFIGKNLEQITFFIYQSSYFSHPADLKLHPF